MNKKIYAFTSAIANTFCDFSLDIAINKYSIYKVLFYTSLISFFFQMLYATKVGMIFTINSIPIILFYGLAMFFGYLFYVKSLKCIPIGFAGLLENLDLFLVFIIDIILGYLVLDLKFMILFIIFLISVIWFGIETNNQKEEIKLKELKWIGVVYLILSVLFYTSEPYLIKIANNTGANEVAINLGYSIIAIPYFYIKSRKEKGKSEKLSKKGILLCIVIGLLEGVYYICGTIGFIYETPLIVNIIEELRVFLLILLSVIFKMDKLNLKKVIAMIIGITSVILLAL